MSERGTHLLEAANGQINELIDLLSTGAEASLKPSLSRSRKVGDGSVAALALHTAESYRRIAGFLRAASQTPSTGPSRDRIRRLLRARSRMPPRHAEGGHDEGTHDGDYAAEMSSFPAYSDGYLLEAMRSASWLT